MLVYLGYRHLHFLSGYPDLDFARRVISSFFILTNCLKTAKLIEATLREYLLIIIKSSLRIKLEVRFTFFQKMVKCF